MSPDVAAAREARTGPLADLLVTTAKIAGVGLVAGLVLGMLVRFTDSPDTNVLRFAAIFAASLVLVLLAVRLGVFIAAWLASRGILFQVVGVGLVLGGLTLAIVIPIVGNRDSDELSTGDVIGYGAIGAPLVLLGAAMLWSSRRGR